LAAITGFWLRAIIPLNARRLRLARRMSTSEVETTAPDGAIRRASMIYDHSKCVNREGRTIRLLE
jgi:hypothetical protein